MKEDAVIKEVRDVRRRIDARYGNDVRKLADALMEKQEEIEGDLLVWPGETVHWNGPEDADSK